MNKETRDTSTREHRLDLSASGRDALQEYVGYRRHIIDEGISTFLHRNYEGRILEMVSDIARGGKRLRGIIAILICEALGGRTEDAVTAAVAVEVAHAASLAHDDVIDGDDLRHGRPALHVRYDVPTAILIPHLLVPHAVLSASVYGGEAIGIILDGWARVAKGQAHDYTRPRSESEGGTGHGGTGPNGRAEAKERASEQYWSIIRNKTAALFEVAGMLGAIAAHNDSNALLARTYASSLGIAFQVADDVVDLQSFNSQPWPAVLNSKLSRVSRSFHALCEILVLPGEEVVTSNAVSRASNLASYHIQHCNQCATRFPKSPVSALIEQFPVFAIDQVYYEIGGGRAKIGHETELS